MGVSIWEGSKAGRAADALDAQTAILNRIANKMGAYEEPLSWAALQAQVRAGIAGLYVSAGQQLEVDMDAILTVIVSGTGVTAAQVEPETFYAAAGTSSTDYVFTYDGSNWIYNGVAVTLATYGITPTGSPVEGDTITVHKAATSYDFDVLGLDEDEPVDTSFDHVLSIQMHKVLSQINFDPSQYLFPVTAESLAAIGISGSVLPAGTYHVTLDHGAYNGWTDEDGTYQFTTTQDVPVGGGIRHSYMGTYQSSSYAKANVLAGTFITYAADTVTTIEAGLATTEGDGGTSLGTATASDPSYKVGDYINYTQRQRYGSNRWSKSWIRQLLNSSEATFSWTPGTVFSRNIVLSPAPAGFLYSLDADLRAVLGKVRKRYALSVSDGGGYEDVEDMVTLATLLDMGGGNNNSIVEGPVDANGTVTRSTAYSLWKNTTNADRIKYRGSSPVHWWLGSSYPSYAYYVRLVDTSGAFDYSRASNSYGVVPSLYII